MNQDQVMSLQAYLQRWTRTHPSWWQWSAEDIASELAQDADFQTIRWADWLQSPDGELIESVVSRLLPPPYNYSADVLADAVKIAAHQRTRRRRLEVLGAGGVMALLLILGFRGK
jgi:hypothetical protein